MLTNAFRIASIADLAAPSPRAGIIGGFKPLEFDVVAQLLEAICDAMERIERDYADDIHWRLAERYPGQHVVFDGNRIVFVTTDGDEADRRYQALYDIEGSEPSVIGPNRVRPARTGITRGCGSARRGRQP